MPGFLKALRISEQLQLPLDAVTQTFGVLAVRGAGKSNLAAVTAEEMHGARLPFVVVDPVGSWWGLRSAGDGKGPGLPIPIFGGGHGDVPLERAAGTLIADLVVGDRLSCVLDVSDFSEGDKTRFLIDFAERLYRQNRDPLHLFLEEADDYAPQKPRHEQARLLGAWENIVRRGRARGLGITMITQRSAVLNKNVLTQIETLFVLRTTSPQDRKAIEAWVEYHGQARDLVESLPSLEAGEAWVWSPSWLKKCERIRVRRRRTFDSAATPRDLAGARPPATLADVDLGAVRERMAATIERAKAEDPKELRRQIAELKRAQAAKPAAAQQKTRDVPALRDRDSRRLQSIVITLNAISCRLEENAKRAQEVAALAVAQASTITVALKAARREGEQVSAPVRAAIQPAPRHAPRPAALQRAARGPSKPGDGDGRLGKLERRILAVLSSVVRPLRRDQLGVRVVARSDAGHFGNCLSALKGAGYVEGGDSGFSVTVAGREASSAAPPTDLVGDWKRKLSGLESEIFEHLVKAYPQTLTRAQLGELTGKRADAGHFGNCLSTLRGNRIADTIDGALRASGELFEPP